MDRSNPVAVADRAAPHALKLIAAVNVLFLGSFIITLAKAIEIALQ